LLQVLWLLVPHQHQMEDLLLWVLPLGQVR
jgi:hypothetical protein